MPPFIHPTATVADNVSIGEETHIGANCVLHPHTRIGDRCRIGDNTEIGPWAYLGDDVRVGEGVRIHSGSEIEDDVLIDNACEIGRQEEKSDAGTKRLYKTFIRAGQRIEKNTRYEGVSDSFGMAAQQQAGPVHYDTQR